jgi:hypothetical protein
MVPVERDQRGRRQHAHKSIDIERRATGEEFEFVDLAGYVIGEFA